VAGSSIDDSATVAAGSSIGRKKAFLARPILGYADYRGPITGLYLCGSGGHPGGGVTGAPGHNASQEILRDFKRKRIGAKGRMLGKSFQFSEVRKILSEIPN
jgi:hypothetical protein